MKKSRNILQLLKLLKKDVVKSNPFYGFCFCIEIMRNCDHTITSDEELILDNYLEKNTPPLSRRWKFNDNFWWKRGSKKPRLRWLDKHIKLNS